MPRKKSASIPIDRKTPDTLIQNAFDMAGTEPTYVWRDAIPGIHLGTSAFTAAGWETALYPPGMKPRDYLTYYSTQFETVEVDSTFYRTPSMSTFNSWYKKTPPGFIFALKVPQVVTHEKILVGCDEEFLEFVGNADILQEKRGPMVLQFPYFNKKAFKSGSEFLWRLKIFMAKLPKLGDCKFAVEIRNKNWLDAQFADALREHGVALVLQDQAWMPRPSELFEKFDPITASFTYIRWLGDRKGIEERTKTWDKTIVNRNAEMEEWVEISRRIHKRKIQIYAYANNHYAGFAPATVKLFQKMWEKI